MQVYIGQLMYVGFNFAPQGWAFCDGSLMSIADNDALFALIGTTFGGDGVSTFALPDLRGRVPVGMGQLGGGGNYVLGQPGGVENVTLTGQQYPQHTHGVVANQNNGTSNTPGGNFLAAGQNIYVSATPTNAMNGLAVSTAPGGNQPHSNLQPYLACNWIISLFGIFPSQT